MPFKAIKAVTSWCWEGQTTWCRDTLPNEKGDSHKILWLQFSFGKFPQLSPRSHVLNRKCNYEVDVSLQLHKNDQERYLFNGCFGSDGNFEKCSPSLSCSINNNRSWKVVPVNEGDVHAPFSIHFLLCIVVFTVLGTRIIYSIQVPILPQRIPVQTRSNSVNPLLACETFNYTCLWSRQEQSRFEKECFSV